jgi:hypothetical protein
VASRRLGDVWIIAVAALPPDSLDAILRGLVALNP